MKTIIIILASLLISPLFAKEERSKNFLEGKDIEIESTLEEKISLNLEEDDLDDIVDDIELNKLEKNLIEEDRRTLKGPLVTDKEVKTENKKSEKIKRPVQVKKEVTKKIINKEANKISLVKTVKENKKIKKENQDYKIDYRELREKIITDDEILELRPVY